MTSTRSNSEHDPSSECIIDVGANLGDFLFPVATRMPDLRVIGIEPIPGLAERLRTRSLVLNLSNVEVWSYAIDVEPRTAKFNVSIANEQGVSSLLDFDAETVSSHEYWVERTDLAMSDVIEVEVRRLDELLDHNGIERIRFIKIDAQGLDLNVLESAGRFTERIDAGVLEVPTVSNARLYEGEPVLHDALNRLEALGFEVYAIKPNDPGTAEVNVYFHRAGVDWREVEESLQLRGVPIYDGKHFWHTPSNSPRPPEAPTAASGPGVDLETLREVRVENAMAWAALSRERRRVESLEHEVAQLTQKCAQLSDQGPEPLHLGAPTPRPLLVRIAARITRPVRRRLHAARQ